MQEIEVITVNNSDLMDNHTRTGLVFYSIGNYVFSNIEELTYKGFLVILEFNHLNVMSFRLLPLNREDLRYNPAGDIKTFVINESLFLNWSDYETYFQFAEVTKNITGYSQFFLLIGINLGILYIRRKKNVFIVNGKNEVENIESY